MFALMPRDLQSSRPPMVAMPSSRTKRPLPADEVNVSRYFSGLFAPQFEAFTRAEPSQNLAPHVG